jgi:gluconokinase
MVLACSALKEPYRRLLRRGLEDRFLVVHLTGPPELIRSRMAAREHFMKPGMLESQLADLEPPVDAVTVGIDRPVGEVVGEILARLGVSLHG